MNGALRAMLEGVIDYAGVFPPAKLSMADALEEYLGIVHGSDKWIVDRFACPVGKLPDLAIMLAEHPEEPFVPVAVIGAQQPDHKHWRHGIEHDAGEMTKFQRAVENHAEIQAYEVRVPDHKHLEAYVTDIESFSNVDLFIELPWGPEMPDSLALLAEMQVADAKARTGGVDRSAFPSREDLAGLIQQCAQVDLSFKLTAGLHHAFPQVDPASGATMHGFLNILVATALAISEDLSRRELEQVLAESDPRAFGFKRDAIVWREHKASLADAENARALFCSFGSCSVREPMDDLSKLGLLEKAAR